MIPSSCGLEEMDIPASVLPLYAFPSLEQLSKATEEELREAGFGYRARYIVKAVQELAEKPGTCYFVLLIYLFHKFIPNSIFKFKQARKFVSRTDRPIF